MSKRHGETMRHGEDSDDLVNIPHTYSYILAGAECQSGRGRVLNLNWPTFRGFRGGIACISLNIQLCRMLRSSLLWYSTGDGISDICLVILCSG